MACTLFRIINEMDENIVSKIRNTVERALDDGRNEFIIFPFGDVGIKTKQVLKECYGLTPSMIIDNKLCKFNSEIHSLNEMPHNNLKMAVILACTNGAIYKDLYEMLSQRVNPSQIYEIDSSVCEEKKQYTKRGKYSYGSLCNHPCVESVGAFCSFAGGVVAVPNHSTGEISTHPMMYADSSINSSCERRYEEYDDMEWYFKGVRPQSKIAKDGKVVIGNDVWLGCNVVVANGAKIGNGVIAAAGAVIIEDVPDYAVVAGVPAKIKKYRYTKPQIEALNRIKWWDWSDDDIRDRYEDLYLPIEEFIEKYDK